MQIYDCTFACAYHSATSKFIRSIVGSAFIAAWLDAIQGNSPASASLQIRFTAQYNVGTSRVVALQDSNMHICPIWEPRRLCMYMHFSVEIWKIPRKMGQISTMTCLSSRFPDSDRLEGIVDQRLAALLHASPFPETMDGFLRTSRQITFLSIGQSTNQGKIQLQQ